MPGSPMKKRAMRILEQHPHMTARGLQEALGCSKGSAYNFIREFRELKGAAPEGMPAVRKPALQLVKGGGVRTPAQALPPATQEIVVDELHGMMEMVAGMRKRVTDSLRGENDEGERVKPLKPLEFSQMANAIVSTTKAIQNLCDTYPGLSQLVARKSTDRTGIQDSDLADVNDWLNVG